MLIKFFYILTLLYQHKNLIENHIFIDTDNWKLKVTNHCEVSCLLLNIEKIFDNFGNIKFAREKSEFNNIIHFLDEAHDSAIKLKPK